MDTNATALFIDACRRGDLAEVQRMCEADPELVNAKDARGFTPLIMAVYSNQVPVVEYLLQHSADVNAQDLAGNTALMGASFKGDREAAALLVKSGADVNLLNNQHSSALAFAVTYGQKETASLLLEAGADISLKDSNGKTPLDHASMQENAGMIELLQKYEKK